MEIAPEWIPYTLSKYNIKIEKEMEKMEEVEVKSSKGKGNLVDEGKIRAELCFFIITMTNSFIFL